MSSLSTANRNLAIAARDDARVRGVKAVAWTPATETYDGRTRAIVEFSDGSRVVYSYHEQDDNYSESGFYAER